LSVCLLATASWAAATFQLGDIPPQAAHHGSTLTFSITSDVPGNVTKTVSGSPQGVISYNAGTFTYTPNSLDKEPFSVTFTGSVSGQAVTQTVKITPIPILKPEADAFGVDSIKPPDEESKDYISKTDVTTTHYDFSPFFIVWTTREVTISGKTVVLQESHPNQLYETLMNDNNFGSLSIYAEKLIIRSPINLPNTANVTIYAKELRFEDTGTKKAFIKTTPASKTEPAYPPKYSLPAGYSSDKYFCNLAQVCNLSDGKPVVPSKQCDFIAGGDGDHGIKAGDITLHIETFYSTPGYDKRFILTGGNGQPAGEGGPGTPALSMTIQENHPAWATTSVWYNHTVYIEAWHRNCGIFGCNGDWYKTTSGIDDFPRSGGAAKSAGKPGNGGKGGIFTSISDVMSYADTKGGIAGSKGADQLGGKKGLPSPAYKVSVNPDGVWSQLASFTSTDGANAPAPSAAIPVGQDGTKSSPTETRQTAWLTPYALEKIIAHAKDAYLYSRNLDYAQSIFDKYVKLLDTYKSQQSAEWASLDPKWQIEFLQMKSEMQTILHRIANNLDYFGNPAGWVPMLSFEANMTAFDNEIDRAINAMYLSYWILNKANDITQRVNAMKDARQKMKDDIDIFKADYNKAVTLISSELQPKSDQIASDVSFLQSELQALEQQLLIIAQQNVEERQKTAQIKLVARTLGTICKYVPIGQPILGAVGTAMTIAASYDQDNPCPALMQLPDIVSAYNSKDLLNLADKWNTSWNGINLGNVDFTSLDSLKKYGENVKNFVDFTTPLGKSLYDAKDVFNGIKVADSEVNAELQRLEAESPEFNDIIGKVKDLMVQKQLFSQKLAQTMQLVATLQDNITHNLIAIDGLSQSITSTSAPLDQRTLMYLKEMDRRARERLLKYHYYMAKAYEYRMLETYTGELNIESLFNKCEALAKTSCTVDGCTYKVLTADEFKELKTLYKDQLAVITATILDKYNTNAPGLSVPSRFYLTSDEINKLNADGSVRLNMMDIGLFSSSEEDIRIVSLKVKNMPVATEGTPGRFANLSLYMEHSGISKLTKNGKVWQFRHYNNDTDNPILWGARYDAFFPSAIDPIEPSAADKSLLTSLLTMKGKPLDGILLYSRPAAWADIVITREVHADNCDLKIKSLMLEVTYEFRQRKTGLASLKVTAPDNDLAPYIIVNTKDNNERQDGVGSFYRTYSTYSTVTLKAPQTYGEWTFDKWTNSSGTTLGTNQILTVSLSSDKVIRPNYIRASGSTGTPGDVNGLGSVELTDAIAALQVLAGLSPPNVKVGADVNGNNKIGLEEVIFILQKVAGLR